MQEKRAHMRGLMHESAVLAEPSGNGRRPVVMLDISELGASFTSPTLLEAGSRLLLDFHLPGKPQLQETVVQVVHGTSSGVPAGFRIGARFVHIQPETRDDIIAFVSSSVAA